MSVDLAQAKAQCRVMHSREDMLITQYMNAARAHLERFTGKKLEAGQVIDRFDRFDDALRLSTGPFISLTSIAYVDGGGQAQVLAGASAIDGLVYAPSAGWPTIKDHSAITVTYQAGYQETPADLDMAQLLLIGHFYNHREAVQVGSGSSGAVELPLGVEALAGPYRRLVLR